MIIYYQLDIVKPLEFTIGTSLFVSNVPLLPTEIATISRFFNKSLMGQGTLQS